MDAWIVGSFHRSRRARLALKAFGIVIVVVALVACVCVGTACSSKDAQQDAEEVHLLVKVPRTSHDVIFDDSIDQIDQVVTKMADAFEASYDEHPVSIEIEVFEQNQYDSAIVDAFDTDRAPDVLYGDYFNMSTYIHSGRVMPLDDVASDEVRAGIFDFLWDLSSVDGKVYMMPYLTRQNVLAYNKDLFRQAGLERFIRDDAIQSWSLEEWTQILDALAANLPEATYPMMMYAGSSQGDTHIMTLLRSAGSSFFDETGHFNLSTPEGIAALRWIQEGNAKGWFPPHCENLEIEDCSSLFRQGQLAIYMVNNASLGRYGETIGLVNFPGPDEDGCATTFISGFVAFDNEDPVKVEVAKDFLAFVYGSQELMSYSAGALPVSKAVAAEYGSQIPFYDLFSENRQNIVDFTGNNPDTRAVREIFYTVMHDLLMDNITPEQAAAEIDERCNEAIDEGIASSVLHE